MLEQRAVGQYRNSARYLPNHPEMAMGNPWASDKSPEMRGAFELARQPGGVTFGELYQLYPDYKDKDRFAQFLATGSRRVSDDLTGKAGLIWDLNIDGRLIAFPQPVKYPLKPRETSSKT